MRERVRSWQIPLWSTKRGAEGSFCLLVKQLKPQGWEVWGAASLCRVWASGYINEHNNQQYYNRQRGQHDGGDLLPGLLHCLFPLLFIFGGLFFGFSSQLPHPPLRIFCSPKRGSEGSCTAGNSSQSFERRGWRVPTPSSGWLHKKRRDGQSPSWPPATSPLRHTWSLTY